PHKPLLWLTILGRDGYWPIVALSQEDLVSADGHEPVVSLTDLQKTPSTLHETVAPLVPPMEESADTPPAWNLALCLCLLILLLHAILSWKGTALADSESRAQFAPDDKDGRSTVIIAIGAFALASALALILLTRSVRVNWDGGWFFTVFLWLLYTA